MDTSYYTANAYCGDNIIARVWRFLDDIYFNVFKKFRNPLTQIIISDLATKEEEKEIIQSIRIFLERMEERW